VKLSKVRLVVQGQHMRRKGEDGVGDYDDAFSPVPAVSGFCTVLSLATQQNMFTDYVDISQAFVQSELLPGDGHNGKVYISSPPGYDKDPLHVYGLLKPLYSMPSAARVWHTTMSAFLAKGKCATVGFEKSMWTVTIHGARILLGAHIDDFVIAGTNRQVLDGFRARLLDAFEGTYEGAFQHYLGCEVTRDMEKGTTYLSQTHYAEEILRTHNFWNALGPTSETEFVAASLAGQEAIYLRETLTDFGFSQTKATLLYEDNLACVAMSENPLRRKFSAVPSYQRQPSSPRMRERNVRFPTNLRGVRRSARPTSR